MWPEWVLVRVGTGGGEELGPDPAAAVEEREVEDPWVGQEGVRVGVGAGGDYGGERRLGGGGISGLVMVVEEGEVLFESIGSEEGGVVETAKEGLDVGRCVGRFRGGDHAGPFAFEGEV